MERIGRYSWGCGRFYAAAILSRLLRCGDKTMSVDVATGPILPNDLTFLVYSQNICAHARKWNIQRKETATLKQKTMSSVLCVPVAANNYAIVVYVGRKGILCQGKSIGLKLPSG